MHSVLMYFSVTLTQPISRIILWEFVSLLHFTHHWDPAASSLRVCIIELSQFSPLVLKARSLHFDLYVDKFTFKNRFRNLYRLELIAEEALEIVNESEVVISGHNRAATRMT